MGMANIRAEYQVPAKRGSRIRLFGGKNDEYGTVVAAAAGHIRVRMDNDGKIRSLHPAREIEYL